MPINLELKARIAGSEAAVEAALRLGARFAGRIHQIDTYFNSASGRLKLRELPSEGQAELISYSRKETGPVEERLSSFEVYPVQNPAHLKHILESTLGVRGVVEKERLLYMYGENRIHIDTVKDLGSFLEFECPFSAGERETALTLRKLTRHFGLTGKDILQGSYSDLLAEREGRRGMVMHGR